MNIQKLLANEHTKVWIEDRIGTNEYVRLIGMRVGVKTIIINPHSAVIVLRELLTTYPGSESLILGNFESGNDILVTLCEVGVPSDFANNTPIFTMRNCEFITSWIPNPVVTQFSEEHPVQAFLIAESWDYEWREK